MNAMSRVAPGLSVALALLVLPATVRAQFGEGGEGLTAPSAPSTQAPQPPQAQPPQAQAPQPQPSEAQPSQPPVPAPPAPQAAPPTAPSPEQEYPTGPGEPGPPGQYPQAPGSAEMGSAGAQGEPTLHIPSRIATRMRVLEEDLNLLAARGGNGIVDGILSVLAGGLSITFGVVANDGTPSDQDFARYLFLWGSGQIARGVISFSIPLNADDAAIELQHMPMSNPDEVRLRLHFGEEALHRVARRSRASRMLDGSINVGVGLCAIPLYLAHNNFEISGANDWFVVFASGLSVVTGVVSLILRSDAEKRWSAYEDLRDRLVKEEQQKGGSESPTAHRRVQWTAGAGPIEGGAAAVVQARF